MSDLPRAIPSVGSYPQNKISYILYKAKLLSLPTLNSEETGCLLVCCILPKGTEELDPFVLEITPLEVTYNASFTNTDNRAQVVMHWFQGWPGMLPGGLSHFPWTEQAVLK